MGLRRLSFGVALPAHRIQRGRRAFKVQMPVSTTAQLFSPNSYRDKRWLERKRQYLSTHASAGCRSCRRGGKVLHVHHINYQPGEEIWKAADSDLCILCEDCHERMTKCLRELRRTFSLHIPAHLAVRLSANISVLAQNDPVGFLHELETIVSRKSRGA